MTRQAFPDRLRGLALLGIIVVNAPFLAISSTGYTEASIAAWWDMAAAFAVIALAQGKFYLLFSFLFGYSALFIVRTGAAPGRRRYRRRLVGRAVLRVGQPVTTGTPATRSCRRRPWLACTRTPTV